MRKEENIAKNGATLQHIFRDFFPASIVFELRYKIQIAQSVETPSESPFNHLPHAKTEM
jgi:hypothetical protein